MKRVLAILAVLLVGIAVTLTAAHAAGATRWQIGRKVESNLTVTAFTALDDSKMRLSFDAKGLQQANKIQFAGVKRTPPLGGLEITPVDVYYTNLAQGITMHLVQPCDIPIYSNVVVDMQTNVARAQAQKAPAHVVAMLQAEPAGGVAVGRTQVGYINAALYTLDGSYAGSSCDQQGTSVPPGQTIKVKLYAYLWNENPETGVYSIELVFGAVDGEVTISQSRG